MGSFKARGSFGILATVSLCAQAGTVADFKSNFDSYVLNSQMLTEQAEDYRSADPADRSTITKYYADIRRSYVAQPLREWASSASAEGASYGQAVEGALRDSVVAFDGYPAAQTEFDECTRRADFKKIGTAASDAFGAVSTLADTMGARSPQFRNAARDNEYGYLPSSNPWTSTMQTTYRDGAVILDKNFTAEAESCCQAATAAALRGEKDPKIAASVRGQVGPGCDAIVAKIKKAQDAFRNNLKAPVETALPNLRDLKMSPADLARAIDTHSTELRSARRNDPTGFYESEALRGYEKDCIQNQTRLQIKAAPISTSTMWSALKALKCEALPAYTTSFARIGWQQLSLGAASVPIQGRTGDASCDPAMLSFYASQRPTDINVLAQKLGVNNMGASPVLKMLVNRPPLLPVTRSNGLVYTKFKVFGVATGATSSTGTTSTSSVSNASSSGRGTIVSSASSVKALTRGLAEGASLSQDVRKVASQIKNDPSRSGFRGASTLKAAVSNARKLAHGIAENGAKTSGSSQRRALAAQATAVKGMLRAVASSNAAGTTGRNILKSFQSKGASQVGNIQNGVNQKQQEIAKQNAKANEIADQVDIVAKKYAEYKMQAMQIDADIDGLKLMKLREVMPLAPKDQYKAMDGLRDQITAKMTEAGQIQTAMYALESEYTERMAALDALAMQTGTKTQWNGGAAPALNTGTGSSGSSNGGSTERGEVVTPPDFPVRTTWIDRRPHFPLETIFDLLVQPAFAAQRARWTNDVEWMRDWRGWLKDYEAYLDKREATGRDQRAKLGQMWAETFKPGDVATARDTDTQLLQTLRIFGSSVEEETSDLVVDAGLSRKDSPNLDGQVLSVLKQAREDARGLSDELNRISMQYLERMPASTDENAEAWWAIVPGMLLDPINAL